MGARSSSVDQREMLILTGVPGSATLTEVAVKSTPPFPGRPPALVANGVADSVGIVVAQQVARVVATRDSILLDALQAVLPTQASAVDRLGYRVTAAALTYVTSAPSVATVDASGNVRAVANGTTVVTAVYGSDTALVAVRQTRPSQLKIINAAGTYTALTASTMPPSVQAAVARAAKHPVRLAELHQAAGEYLARQLHCEAALVTSGAASGLTLGTAACMTAANKRPWGLGANLNRFGASDTLTDGHFARPLA